LGVIVKHNNGSLKVVKIKYPARYWRDIFTEGGGYYIHGRLFSGGNSEW
jgi:hypothetical protein